ncbi:hypothetical protein HAX54_031820, partial [Datura stramonium]|nr:hypothetical protein [Datura stramonium]
MGVLFTLPSRYYFVIGHLGVFSLARWSLLIHMGFHVPHVTRANPFAWLALTQVRVLRSLKMPARLRVFSPILQIELPKGVLAGAAQRDMGSISAMPHPSRISRGLPNFTERLKIPSFLVSITPKILFHRSQRIKSN